MKAAVCTGYGGPEILQIREVEKPVHGEREILVKVYATTVNAGDSRMRSFTVPRGFRIAARMALGIRKPRRPVFGMELSGVVEAVAEDVKRFSEGDQVFGSTFSAGFGGHAEYNCLPEDGVLAIKPDSVSFEKAAAISTSGGTALRFLRRGGIRNGQEVLV